MRQWKDGSKSMRERYRIVAYRPMHWLKRNLRPSWRKLRRMPHRVNLFAVRIAVRIFPLIAIERHRLYPPARYCSTTAEWISTAGNDINASITRVDAASIVSNPLPKTIHKGVRQQFLTDETYAYPETFVATIPRGRVLKRGLVITPDGQLLQDVSTYFPDPPETLASSISVEWKFEKLTPIEGRVAVLTTDGANLYYHWLFQLLPRFELIRRAGIETSRIDYFVVNSQKSRFQRETLALLGIDHAKIIASDQVPYLTARELVVPSVPLGGGCFRPWMTDFLRASFLSMNHKKIRSSGRRLYISRAKAGYRRVLNEPDVVELLRRRGFETAAFETLSVSQQAAAMASCDAVVAPHGGGLSNIVFCSPGTKVIEIFSPELVAGYFWKLSNQMNLDYYYLLGKGAPATLQVDYPQSWNAGTDIEVDLEMLEKTLTLANIS